MQISTPCRSSELDSDPYRHIQFLSEMESAFAAISGPRTAGDSPALFMTDGPANAPLAAGAAQFLSWVLGHAGVNPECYRHGPLARRLAACLRALRVRSVTEARRRLEREPEQLALAASTLLIGVTQFFRDSTVFRYLESAVLPKLAAHGPSLRVWSAGCSDGAELYSVAMLLADRGLLSGSTLLGTDCRADAIRQARLGWYESARLAETCGELQQTYFVQERGGGRICESLRQATRWQQSDVLTPLSRASGEWDLILCRNLAIYLEPTVSHGLWTSLIDALRTGGVLVVGKAERPDQQLSLSRLAPCVFEKRS